MLSRVANNLFWIGRYMERSYGILLSTKIAYSKTQDYNLSVSKDKSDTNKEVKSDFASLVQNALFNSDNLNSVFNLTFRARENCRSIQEEVSRELWLCINNKYLFLRDNKNKSGAEEDPLKVLEEISNMNYLYYGIADLTQERGSAYCFMNCGKYLERIFRTLHFLEDNFIKEKKTDILLEDTIYWKNLLLSIGGYQLYLRTYKSAFRVENIIDMLVFNKSFPHSIYYSIKKLETHIERLNEDHSSSNNNLIFLIGKLESRIKYTTLDALLASDLNEVIDQTKEEVYEIANRFNDLYFSNY